MIVLIILIYENYCLEVRWFKVRGLGESQQQEILNTKLKILNYLEIAPLTYQKLHNLSSISPGSLGKRLHELVEQGWVVTYTYGIPHNRFFYGYAYNHQTLGEYLKAPDRRPYFFINILKDEIKELLSDYRNEASEPRNKDARSSAIKEAIIAISEKEGNVTKLDKFILVQVKNRHIEWLELPKIENRLKDDAIQSRELLVAYIDSILAYRFLILDAVIKCCHQPTFLTKEGIKQDILPMFRYRDMMEILLETKFKNKLIMEFALLSRD